MKRRDLFKGLLFAPVVFLSARRALAASDGPDAFKQIYQADNVSAILTNSFDDLVYGSALIADGKPENPAKEFEAYRNIKSILLSAEAQVKARTAVTRDDFDPEVFATLHSAIQKFGEDTKGKGLGPEAEVELIQNFTVVGEYLALVQPELHWWCEFWGLRLLC